MKYFELRQEPIYNRHKGEEMMNSTVTPVVAAPVEVPKIDLSALSPHLQEVVKDIMALKAIQKSEHFITYKSQRELLRLLDPQDLATVARILAGIK